MLGKTIVLGLVMTMSMYSSVVQAVQYKVLMVISGNAKQIENTDKGYEFDEFAKAYLVFKENNIAVQVASPQGGKVAPSKFDDKKDFNAEVLADKNAMTLLENSLAFSNINPTDFDGIFIVGGSGAMYDLPEDENLQTIIADVYESQGVVAAVCHGPAALVNVKLGNNQYLVSGRKVNAFTNDEEFAFNKKSSSEYDFLIEDIFKERDAFFESSPLLMSHSVADNRLVTGQNQHSTGATAQNFLKALGVSNIKMPIFKDEVSMAMVSRVLKGEIDAIKELQQNPDNFTPKLIGLYARFYAKNTQDIADIEKAVLLMEAVLPYVNHPKLNFSLAKNLIKLNRFNEAKKLLDAVLIAQPKNTKAKELLAKITQAS